MRKFVCVAVLGCLLTYSGPCLAQGWPPWADDIFGDRSRDYDRRWREPDRDRSARPEDRRPATGTDVRSGGPRPEIVAAVPPIVAFAYDFPANSIVIETGSRKLYYVLPDKQAYEYRISVGREGFNWTGTEKISRKQAWPDWYPPAEMRERDASLPEKMTGGLKNPLGATALYLGDTLYRIHGTNDVKSIGHAQSSGCFRMLNSAVTHLASIAEIGTAVSVVPSLPERAKISRAPAVPPPPANQPAASANSPPPPATQPPTAASQPPPAANPPPLSVDLPPQTPKQPPTAASQPPPEVNRPPRPAAGQPPTAEDLPPRATNLPPPVANQPRPQASSERPVSAASSERERLPDYQALRNYTLERR